MSKKFNVENIVNERTNELDHSPLFQFSSAPVASNSSTVVRPEDITQRTPDYNASMPANQNAGKPASQNPSIPEIQHASIPDIQHNTTATEKVTYRFHSQGKYAIEDIKTILSRKLGIKASYEAIAEEAILIAHQDLLENQHASKLATRFSGKPESKQSS